MYFLYNSVSSKCILMIESRFCYPPSPRLISVLQSPKYIFYFFKLLILCEIRTISAGQRWSKLHEINDSVLSVVTLKKLNIWGLKGHSLALNIKLFYFWVLSCKGSQSASNHVKITMLYSILSQSIIYWFEKNETHYRKP